MLAFCNDHLWQQPAFCNTAAASAVSEVLFQKRKPAGFDAAAPGSLLLADGPCRLGFFAAAATAEHRQ